MNWAPPPRKEYTNAERNEQIKASIYYKRKMLGGSEENARYNHFMAALAVAAGDSEAAKKHYQMTVAASPGDVLARSDYALHLQRSGRQHENDAREELRKALLIAPDHAVLHKNAGALLAQSGKYREGQQHLQRSLQLNENDAMAHRNFATVTARLGDTRTALKHNLQAISMEDPRLTQSKTSTRAYRAAAVQIVTLGGDKNQSYALMDAARAIEGQKCKLATSAGTSELLLMMMNRRGDAEAELEREREKEREKLNVLAQLANEDVGTMLKKVLSSKKRESK